MYKEIIQNIEAKRIHINDEFFNNKIVRIAAVLLFNSIMNRIDCEPVSYLVMILILIGFLTKIMKGAN